MKAGMKILDMRCRPPFKGFLNEGYPFTLYDKGQAHKLGFMLSGCPVMSKTMDTRSMDDFCMEMDRAGVDLAVAPYRTAWGDPVNHRPPTDNGDLVELMERWPDRFLGVPGFSPVYHSPDDIAAQIDRLLVRGPLRGMAMEPIIDRPNWILNDKRAMVIYELAQQHRIPVLFTYSSMPFDHVAALQDVAAAFPDVNFVLCHGGTPYTMPVIDLAFSLGNIYLSPDGNMVNTAYSRAYIDAGNTMLRDRIVFGSAFPITTMEHAVDYYLHCGFREEVLPDIMYNNAARLFGLTPQSSKS